MHMRFLAETYREVIVHRLVVEKIFLDHVAAVSKAQHEIVEAVVGIRLHDVP